MFFNNIMRKIINKDQQVTTTDPTIAEYNQQLLAAMQATDVAGVKLALEKGADPNTCGNKQRPAIVIAAGSKSNSTELVHALITHSDIPVDLDQRSKEDNDWTALMTAVANKNYGSVNLLLEAGSNTKLKHNFGRTASKIARMHDLGELNKTIKKFRKLNITPQLLDKQAYKMGKFFAKTKYYYDRSNKKTHSTTKPLPEEVLMLIGSFLYPKSRLDKHFVVGFDTIKQKSIKANKI